MPIRIKPSRVFRQSSRRLQREARRTFQQSEVGQATSDLRRAFGGNAATRHAMSLLRQVSRMGGSPARMSSMMTDMVRSGRVQRYQSAGEVANAAVDALLSGLGPFGNVVRELLRGRPEDQIRDADLDAAANLLRAFGFEVLPPGKSARTATTREKAAVTQFLSQMGFEEPAKRFPTEEGELLETEARRQVGPRRRQITMINVDSSNVHSFGYDVETQILAVRYLAPVLAGRKIKRGRVGKGGRRGPASGRPGVILGKSTKPGPLYHYFDVPENIFQRMVNAQSKGKFVWDQLRIRGSLFGHRYKYALVGVTASPVVGSRVGLTRLSYTPRQATEEGYIRRELRQGRVRRRSLLPTRRFPAR